MTTAALPLPTVTHDTGPRALACTLRDAALGLVDTYGADRIPFWELTQTAAEILGCDADDPAVPGVRRALASVLRDLEDEDEDDDEDSDACADCERAHGPHQARFHCDH